MNVTVGYDFLPKRPSVHAGMVMDRFGLGFEAVRHVIAEKLDLPIQAGDVVLFTGASGSGKSSLLREVAKELQKEPSGTGRVVDVDGQELGERLLVDGLELPADETFELLTRCGLGEARLMLRTPRELSDGQRYRYRLALAFAKRPAWIVADEFTATLDRTLAKVIAWNVSRTARARGAGLLLATTHEDVVEDLQPDVHVRCRLEGEVDVQRGREKKKRSALRGTSTSRPVRSATGRISLGGIIEVTRSGMCDG